ncbi:MAG: virulence-associated E family protein [Oscillospiraceae bacterium]|nr:virulence-associated E family protein [Oscillospiraceae bacterium]
MDNKLSIETKVINLSNKAQVTELDNKPNNKSKVIETIKTIEVIKTVKAIPERKLKISIGRSRFEKKWINKEFTKLEFIEILKVTKRTPESVSEYQKMSKSKKDAIKDVGGFVLGHLKNGVRRNNTIHCRSAITLDADFPDPDFLKRLETDFDYDAVLYSTHSHTNENPRYRLIVFTDRRLTPEEYTPVSRILANEIGIDCFDDSTYEPSRLMYWPSTSFDGRYIFKVFEGKEISADLYLRKLGGDNGGIDNRSNSKTNGDWRDCSLWPTSKRQSEIIKREIGRKQADPLLKEGVVGAFCRSFNIHEAIENFLSDVYEPSTNGTWNSESNGICGLNPERYTYTPGECSSGLVVYDDKFAYSHHATDPAHGKLLNSFDLVRIHRFGEFKDKISFNKMYGFAVQNEKVKEELLKNCNDKAKEDFGDDFGYIFNSNNQNNSEIINLETDKNEVTNGPKDNSWKKLLELDKTGHIKETFGNYLLILNNDPNLKNIAFNQMRDGVDVRGKVPWQRIKPGWNETDSVKLYEYLQHSYRLYSPNKSNHAVIAAASKRVFHPIKNYLESLPVWDGNKRVETLLIEYFGAEDNAYVKAVTRKTLAAAIARIYSPGIKFDYMLVLNGMTGLGKSAFFGKLAGKWFSDSLSFSDMAKGKEAPEKIQGFWIIEIPELAGIRRTDVNNVKAFLSCRDDNYRACYGRVTESHPRQCIIVGSTNSESLGFLQDVTGNRRFWPVAVTGACEKRGWDISDSDIPQIWAEAKEIWNKGERLFLDSSLEQMAESAQKDALESDEREGFIREYLERLLPENWNDLDTFQRQQFLRSDEVGTVQRQFVCNMEIWCECFENRREDFGRKFSYTVTLIMEKIGGWVKSKKKQWFKLYGNTPAWIRVSKNLANSENSGEKKMAREANIEYN